MRAHLSLLDRVFVLCAAAFAGAGCEEESDVDGTIDTVSIALSPAGASESVLITRHSAWLVNFNGTDLGTAWRQHSYSADGWSWMAMPAGYGESYVNSATTRPFTMYYRKDFFVDDASRVTGLRLDAMYDDGFVFYVNGQEGGRVSMPSGTVTYNTRAFDHEAGNAYVPFDISSVRGALQSGWNTLAVECHQTSSSSSDLVFDGSLVALIPTAPPPLPPPPSGGISRHNTWSYWDQGGDLGTSWRAASFNNDSAWPHGTGPLGYGESYLFTTVSFGPSSSNKHITTYFRRKFTVADPSAITSIRGELRYDDGVVVYLNGVEIGRASMPAGPVSASTRAFSHEAGNTYEGYDWTAQKSLIVAGENTVAVEVHQVAPTSSDLVFDLAMILQTGTPPPPPPPTGGISRLSSWKYWDEGGDLGSSWRALAFNDSGWASGPGPLGYGESYLGTTVSFGPSASNKHITTYFRKTFTVSDPSLITALRGELMYDDGIVVTLNGHEIGTASMPGGPRNASTRAFGHEAGNVYEDYDWTWARTLLVAGENVIAAEVHQSDPTSSDLVFDLALLVTADASPGVAWTKHPENPRMDGLSPSVIKLSDTSWLLYFSPDAARGELRRSTSTDGIHWSAPATLLVGPADDFNSLVDPFVHFDGSMYRLYYSNAGNLHYATSADGIGWAEYPGPILEADHRFESPTVLKDGATWHLWYSGLFHPDDLVGQHSIGYATSPDGQNWTDHGEIFGRGRQSRRLSVIKEGAEFRGWFSSMPFQPDFSIYTATSPDGMHWTLAPDAVLSPDGEGTWEGRSIGEPYVLPHAGGLRMYYIGQMFQVFNPSQIGMATSP